VTRRTALLIASMLGFLAVALGAFGAHGLEGRVEPDLVEPFEIGARYQMFHALALLGVAGWLPRLGRAGAAVGWLWLAGAVVFSGSLYLLTLTGQRWLGAITPLGGVALLAGWLTLFVATLRYRPADD
jgi:uncharacterized membrane protein YgdD (TMEM256/DUF423 family)